MWTNRARTCDDHSCPQQKKKLHLQQLQVGHKQRAYVVDRFNGAVHHVIHDFLCRVDPLDCSSTLAHEQRVQCREVHLLAFLFPSFQIKIERNGALEEQSSKREAQTMRRRPSCQSVVARFFSCRTNVTGGLLT